MRDLNTILQNKLTDKEFAKKYHRLAPFYRLGDQLVYLRKLRGMTQTDLANKSQTTQAVISRLENVSVHCSLETVIRLAEALDAFVDLKLVPQEERNMAADRPVSLDCADTEAVAPDSIVYFGRKSEPAARNMTWFQPPSTSFGKTIGINPSLNKKQKKLEIA